MIIIDGSEGEGGGQVVRNALALSLVTGQPFRITNIRGGRAKPGLMRQHLTAVEAACTIGNAECEGVAIGSGEIAFRPGSVRAGDYRFAVGTAGQHRAGAADDPDAAARRGWAVALDAGGRHAQL